MSFFKKLATAQKLKMVDLHILQSSKWQNILNKLSEVLSSRSKLIIETKLKKTNVCADYFSLSVQIIAIYLIRCKNCTYDYIAQLTWRSV